MNKTGSNSSSTTTTATASPDPSILRDRPTGMATDNRLGREAGGEWPEVSRTKLALRVKRSVSAITGVLNGRIKPTLELAVEMARLIGVTTDELHHRIGKRQRQRQRKQFRNK